MHWLFVLATMVLACQPLHASAMTAAPGEPRLQKFWREWQENLRVAIDLSTRTKYTTADDKWFFWQFAGMDIHKVFSNDERDIATAVGQLYLTKIDFPRPMKPWFFDDSHDTKFIPRIVTVNFHIHPDRCFNIKIGHFELPFGYEYVEDTNGTLHDIMHVRNLGLKTDYGITLNGFFNDLDYEIGFSRGSGIEYTSTGCPWLISGRIGFPLADCVNMGISGFWGEVLDKPGVTRWKGGLPSAEAATTMLGYDGNIRRQRAALDLEWIIQAFTVIAEFTYGRDYTQDVSNNMIEVNWRSCVEDWVVYSQIFNYNQDFSTGWEHAWELRLGAQWMPDAHWDISFQYEQQLDNFNQATENANFLGQLRVRF